MNSNPRILRITTVPISLKILLNGQLSFFKSKGFEVLAVSADGKEVKALQDDGIQHRVVPMTRKITPLRDFMCLIQLISIMRTFKPHIVHTHTPKAGLLGMLAAWFCGVPMRLHTVAGLPLMEAKGITKQILVFTEKITYWCATKVYPNSTGLLTYIQNSIYKGRKLNVIGKGSSNGIDTSYFSPTATLLQKASDIRRHYNIAENDIVYSFVGRIVKAKGIGELIEAYRSITRDNLSSKKIFLLLIGPFEQELDPLSPEDYKFLHENPQVVLAGFQVDVRPWLMASDVFVFPSYREGFPNVVMQASCLNIPCIVSDINGCNEIIQQGNTGLIVPVKNAGRLREAMEKLAAEEKTRLEYAGKSRQYIIENFDQQFVWHELLKEYSMLLTERGIKVNLIN